MFTVVPTNDLAKSTSMINPVFRSTCTVIGIVAIMTANAAVVEPLRGFEANVSSCISTPYIPASDYNGNINLNWDGISFMTAKIADSIKRLDEIAALQANWNGNGASAFSKAIIDMAQELVSSLSVQPIILPTGQESIQMEYEKENGDYLEFELFESGRLKVFTYTHVGKAETKDILLSMANEVVCNFYERYI